MRFQNQGDRITAVLDLNVDSLSLYRNGEWLGVMEGCGLRAHAESAAGPGAGCCWAVSMPTSVLVRIEAAGEIAPPPPAVEEAVPPNGGGAGAE